MDESSRKEDRQVLSYNARSAKVLAGRLWHGDLDNWIAFVKDETIVTGQLKKLHHETRGDRGLNRSKITVVLKSSRPYKEDYEVYEIQPDNEVWIMDSKPEVSLNGIYLKEKR